MLNIGTKIKQLRISRHITQDQLAVFLGVTPRAVSRWEAGNGYPDIETIPMLADYFSVSSDELLGIKKDEREEKLAQIYSEIDRFNEIQDDEAALAFARKAVAEFTSEIKLQINLAHSICRMYMWEPSRDVSKLGEAEKIYETVIANCTDADMRNSVLFSLCSLYSAGYKDMEKARKTAMRVPSMRESRECILSSIYDLSDEQGMIYLQDYISKLADTLGSAMIDSLIRDGVPNGEDTWEIKLVLLDKIISIYDIVFGDDLNYLHDTVSYLHRIKATYLVAMNRYDETLDELEAMCEHCIKASLSKPGDKFTSYFTDRLTQPDVGDDYFDWYTVHNTAYYVLNYKLTQGRYDAVRDTERFKNIVKRLEQVQR